MFAPFTSLPSVQLTTVLIAVLASLAVQGWLVVDTLRARHSQTDPEPALVELAWILLPGGLLFGLYLSSVPRLGAP